MIEKVIREKRLKKGLTQAELAAKMGYSTPSAVTMWENGERRVPSDKLPELAKALGCSINQLFGTK